MDETARRYFPEILPRDDNPGRGHDGETVESHVALLYNLTNGNLAGLNAALDMLQVEAYQWLYLRRQQQEREWRWQAALHGAKLKDEYRASTNPQGVPALVQTFSGKMAVERIIVSKAELELRRGNCE